MATYFLSYDLHHEDEHDYQALYKVLEALDAIRVLESVWCLKAESNSATELLQSIKQCVHEKDSLLIIEDRDWAGRHFINSPDGI